MVSDEYLIKTTDGTDYQFGGKSIQDCISPDDLEFSVVPPKYGDVGVVINSVELCFCLEPPGLQVAIEEGESTEQEISSILNAVISKLEKTTGKKGEYIPL